MRHIFFRLLAGLVLIAAIAGIAFLAYNAGVAHGTAINVPAPAGQTGSPTTALPYWWPFPFFGFGFFGLLAVLFLASVAFSAFRYMLWGPRFGRYWMHRRYGNWGEAGPDEGVPPMVAEMHRRMHEAEQGKADNQASQK